MYAHTQNTNNAGMKSLGQKGRGVIGKKYSYGLELENGLQLIDFVFVLLRCVGL